MEENKSINEIESFGEFAGEPVPTAAVVEANKLSQEFKKIAEVKDVPRASVPATKPRVEAGENGVLMPRDFEGAYRMAQILCDSKTLPAAFDTPAKVFAAAQLAYELGLTPMVAFRNMMVVNGTVALWGDLPLSLVMRSGKLKDLREWWFDKDGKEISAENGNLKSDVFGSTCVVERVGMSPVTRTFTMDDAKKAGLIDKNRSLWKIYPKRMIQCRTRAWALKDRFADVLNGCCVAEYDMDTMPTPGDQAGDMTTSSEPDKAAALNGRFGKKSDAIDAEISTGEN